MLHLANEGDGVFLPAAALDRLPDADETELRVLLFAATRARAEQPFDENDVAEALSLPVAEAKASVKFWRGAGVFTTQAKKAKSAHATQEKKEKKPLRPNRTAHYNSEELCRLAEENEPFKNLLDMAQNAAGQMFNVAEIEILAGLYSHLCLAPEYILSLIQYFVCKREKPLRYVEKVAYDLIDRSISTPEALEEHLQYLEQYESREGCIRKMFGIGGRKLSEKEVGFLSDWFDRFDDDVILLAYEKTVNSTGKASLSYANSILRAWHEAGLLTARDIQSAEEKKDKGAPKHSAGKTTAQSFDVDEFFSKAIARSYGETEEKP